MPYCRKCGTRLDEDAHFCHKCGTPVATFAPSAPTKSAKPLMKEPLVIAVLALIAVLVTAAIVVAVVFAPLFPVNFNQTNQDNHSGVNTLNLNVQANTAQINVITQNVADQNILLVTSAVGSRNLLESSNRPVEVTFTNETANNVLTITSNITETNGFSRNLHVKCTIYVNPTLNLNLNITTQAGKITLASEKSAIFQSINLQANAGDVEATLQNASIAGTLSLNTQAGTIYLGMSQASIQGNQTVDLHSNAGSVNMDVTQTATLQGDLQINATTVIGSVNAGLAIDGDVGAKIISQTSLGSIHLDLQHFSGNQSPIQSDNYPAGSNIEINNRTTLGSINITADYQSSTAPNLRN